MKEFKNGQDVETLENGVWLKRTYVGKINIVHTVYDPKGGTLSKRIDQRVREVEPETTFVDLVIDWSGDRPTFENMENYTGIIMDDLEDWQVGIPYKGWVLVGYNIKSYGLVDKPVMFSSDRKSITNKACTGRFVEI
tara:strand:+ start:545 stop:955 length:411 start_codon:yes stop_codon:yes gene_type:complete